MASNSNLAFRIFKEMRILIYSLFGGGSFGAVLLKLWQDNIQGWANEKISSGMPTVMEYLVLGIGVLAENPLLWVATGCLIVIAFIFSHAYYCGWENNNAATGDTFSVTSTVTSAEDVLDTRIPLIELRDEATGKGWDLSGKNELVLEFCLALQQAGLDGEIQFYGRKKVSDNFESHNRQQPLDLIPTDHWRKFQIEPIRFMINDNFAFRTYVFPSLKSDGYVDLHVNTKQAMKWLATTAEKAKKVDQKKWQ